MSENFVDFFGINENEFNDGGDDSRQDRRLLHHLHASGSSSCLRFCPPNSEETLFFSCSEGANMKRLTSGSFGLEEMSNIARGSDKKDLFDEVCEQKFSGLADDDAEDKNKQQGSSSDEEDDEDGRSTTTKVGGNHDDDDDGSSTWGPITREITFAPSLSSSTNPESSNAFSGEQERFRFARHFENPDPAKICANFIK